MLLSYDDHGGAHTPPEQIPDGHTFPHRPQLRASLLSSTHALPATSDGQICPGGQQKGLMPVGGRARPGVLSATCPGGQQISSAVLKRATGQQIRGDDLVMPIAPRRIIGAHLVFGGQQVRSPSTVQHARPFWQQRFGPQQRLVRLSQHFVPHSSSVRPQRLQRPVLSLAQRHLGGQHFLRPHHA